MRQFALILRLLRPHQWLKNGFVFVGVLFGHAWTDVALMTQALLAFASFCLLASGVYVMNDLIDRDQDRLHPVKCHRPLASGALSVTWAVAAMLLCFAAALLLIWMSSTQAAWVFAAYLLLNIGYSLGLKNIVVLDVFIIATGFMLRILAGTIGIGIVPSLWLELCGLMVTLFLGFAKRQAEFNALVDQPASQHRPVLACYTPRMLDQYITIAATGTVVSYSLYTLSAETTAIHGTTHLVYTVPMVVYGMFRYLFLLHQHDAGGDPARDVLRDKHLLFTFVCWFVVLLVVLQGWL